MLPGARAAVSTTLNNGFRPTGYGAKESGNHTRCLPRTLDTVDIFGLLLLVGPFAQVDLLGDCSAREHVGRFTGSGITGPDDLQLFRWTGDYPGNSWSMPSVSDENGSCTTYQT